ncbi:MAG TPA: hypothetical protein VJT31_19585, partial [Rugosimonospora sp.]|nr:hypothetical protein [Rugosimonospora sp.]
QAAWSGPTPPIAATYPVTPSQTYTPPRQQGIPYYPVPGSGTRWGPPAQAVGFVPQQRVVSPESGQPRRSRWLFLIIGVAVVVFVLLVGGATWYGLTHRTTQPAGPPHPVVVGPPGGGSSHQDSPDGQSQPAVRNN